MRFSEMVFKSLAARIESMMVTYEASVSGVTIAADQLLCPVQAFRGYIQDMLRCLDRLSSSDGLCSWKAREMTVQRDGGWQRVDND